MPLDRAPLAQSIKTAPTTRSTAASGRWTASRSSATPWSTCAGSTHPQPPATALPRSRPPKSVRCRQWLEWGEVCRNVAHLSTPPGGLHQRPEVYFPRAVHFRVGFRDAIALVIISPVLRAKFSMSTSSGAPGRSSAFTFFSRIDRCPTWPRSFRQRQIP
jgi:hypothetical protein